MPAQTNKQNLSPLILPLAVIIVVLVALYGLYPYNLGYGLKPVSVFNGLWAQWTYEKNDDWAHCLLVPLISLGLIYMERKKLLALPLENSPMIGGICIAGAGLFYWLGYKIDISVLGYFSFQATLAALIVWFFGVKFMRALFFSWIFLTFAWPMPFIDTSALRLIMTKVSTLLLNFIGMPAMQNGTAIISAPHFEFGIPAGQMFSLEVAAACSGMRSLFALMMMSALAGYLMLDKPWQRWFLFFCSVPLAIVGNICRIIMLAFGAQMFGAGFAIGTEENPSTYHMFAGFMVFVVALGGMFVIGWLLNGGWRLAAQVCGINVKTPDKAVS